MEVHIKLNFVCFGNFGTNSENRIAYVASMYMYDKKEDWKKLVSNAHRLNAISVRKKCSR